MKENQSSKNLGQKKPDYTPLPEAPGDDVYSCEDAAKAQKPGTAWTPGKGISDDDPATNSFAL